MGKFLTITFVQKAVDRRSKADPEVQVGGRWPAGSGKSRPRSSTVVANCLLLVSLYRRLKNLSLQRWKETSESKETRNPAVAVDIPRRPPSDQEWAAEEACNM